MWRRIVYTCSLSLALGVSGASAQSPCSSVPSEAEDLLPYVFGYFTDPSLQGFRDAVGIATVADTVKPETLYHQPALCQDILDTSLVDARDEPIWPKIEAGGYHHYIGKIGPYYALVLDHGPFNVEMPDERGEALELGYALLFIYELRAGELVLVGRGLI